MIGVDTPLYLLKTRRMVMIKMKRMKWERAMNEENKNVGLRLAIKQVHKILKNGDGVC